jgi:hypothetical protein
MTDPFTMLNQSRSAVEDGSDHGEEVMVPDQRASLSPAQIVEQRLLSMLKHTTLPLSHVQRRLTPGPR